MMMAEIWLEMVVKQQSVGLLIYGTPSRILYFLHHFTVNFTQMKNFTLRKVVSSNMSRLEAHAGFFRLLMKGIFDSYVL